MLKFIVIIALCIVSLIVGLGNYKQLDNSMPEDEKNILLDLENQISEENTIAENSIEEDVAKENIVNEDTVSNESVNDSKEEKKIATNASSSKEEIKVNSNKEANKTINKSTESNSKVVENKVEEKKEEVVKEENKQEVIVEEKTEQKEENTNEEIKEEIVVQETKYEYVYNYDETQRLKRDIEEAAKGNPDLFDDNGNKLYRVSEFKSKEQAMNRTNYFSPYNYLEVKGVVQNTYSCTFLVYAIDYKINGILQQTRYYIKVSEY